MAPSKKKKRPEAAQQLIDSLLDDQASSDQPFSIELDQDIDNLTPTPAPEPSSQVVFEQGTRGNLKLEKSTSKSQSVAPPFLGGQPVVTQMYKPAPKPTIEELEDWNSADPDEEFKPKFDVEASENSSPNISSFDDAVKAPTAAPNFALPEAPSAPIGQTATKIPPPAQASSEDERTMRLVVNNPPPKKSPPPVVEDATEAMRLATESRTIDRHGETEIRPGIRIPPAPKLNHQPISSHAFSSAEASLKQSESLRIAQARITELEQEIERLRRDNESLTTAGDTMRRRTDELTSMMETLEVQARESKARLEEEKTIMRGQLQAKDRENAKMRTRVEEIETRLESNFKKIRVRERELEHRLEIVKMEHATLISTKDKMILDLKRQIDQLNHESETVKSKTQELYKQYKDKEETQARVVRALRIALTILEGDDDSLAPFKKTE